MKRKLLTTVLLLASSWLATPILAENPDQFRQLQSTNKCEGCDLRGANLYGASLSAASLKGANLSGADLRRTNLSDAVLIGANLSGVDLSNANLRGADLTDANLNEAKLTTPSLNDSTLCNTIMPNQKVSKRDCSWQEKMSRTGLVQLGRNKPSVGKGLSSKRGF